MLKSFFLYRCFPLIRFNLHAGAVGEFLKRFLEIDPVFLHHELEDITALVAFAETTPCSRLRPNDKSRCVFVGMERTKASVIPAGLAQFDAGFGNEVNNINARFDFVGGGHDFENDYRRTSMD